MEKFNSFGMLKRIPALALLPMICCTPCLTAQSFGILGIFNAYSFLRSGLPNYGIAEGSIFTLYLSNPPSGPTGSQGVPLQTTFLGVKIDVTVNGVTTHAIPYYVSPGQINAILPSNTPAGDGDIMVSSGGQTASGPIHVVQSAFGLLAGVDVGSNVAVVQNASQGGELLGQTNAANPGEYLLLWGTGLGPVAGDETQYQTPSNLTNIPIEVDIGGVSAAVVYHGRSAYPGLDQINVVVPRGVSGCFVSVVVVAGGVPSNFATIPVASSGRLCSDPDLIPVASAEYQTLLGKDNVNVGTIALAAVTPSSPTANDDMSDSAYAFFQKYTGQQFRSFGPNLEASMGSCVVFSGAPGPPPYLEYLNYLDITSPVLNAGPLVNVNGPGGPLALADVEYSGYFLPFNMTQPIIPPGGGAFTFDNGPGGPEVGPFKATLYASLTNPLVWTNRSSITEINRASGQLITWTGGTPGTYVSIYGYTWAHEYSPLKDGDDVYTNFLCNAPVSGGKFTVPAPVLESLLPLGAALATGLPPSGNGYLFVVSETIQSFSAPGLDLGLMSLSAGTGISVPFN